MDHQDSLLQDVQYLAEKRRMEWVCEYDRI